MAGTDKIDREIAKLPADDRRSGDAPDVAYTEEEEFGIMKEMGMRPEQVANSAEAVRYKRWLDRQTG